MFYIITLNEVVEFIHNPLSYKQHLVSIINDRGMQIPLNHSSELYEDKPKTIKVEGMERYSKGIWDKCCEFAVEYNHHGPVTCHAFIAQINSPSFDMHTDPDDVIIVCCEGKKTMMVDGTYIVLEAGEHVHIPANTPHQALNEYAALTLSFGLENYLKDKSRNELDVLPKDD